MKRALGFFFLSILLGDLSLFADVTPNGLFADNAVLQRGMRVPVWGTAADGERVSVKFGGQKVSTVTKDGKWKVWLAPMKASSTPQTMTITGSSTVTLNNILVGEVWVCSGQSNMERQLGPRPPQKPLDNWVQEAASANYPLIREVTVPRTTSTNPLLTLSGTWVVCTPETAPTFTAVGYYFGRDLYKNLNVPIGLIHSSWGGTVAEAWTRHEVLANDPDLSPILNSYDEALALYPDQLAKYKANEQQTLKDYETAVTAAKAAGKPTPPAPKAPVDPVKYQNSPSNLYNGMISPLLPFAIRGVIWYQGESNAPRPKQYQKLFPAMITDWRAQWKEGDFPFLFVQVAPYNLTPPAIREAQLFTALTTKHTAMVVTSDIGDATNIHPTHKEPVGDRLAIAARALAYGQPLEYSGPLYKRAKVSDGKMTIYFTHAASGLTSWEQPLKGFTIAGADKVFVPAQAEIKGQTVVVSSPEVAAPVAVRYGWANVPDCNLYNVAGLPASPFRTDPD
jgi:sialate O-acetylesterase